jgi:aspartyl-tRNA(Asn)/glutamyl-tRNA(Gln) amidotransferase subunit A
MYLADIFTVSVKLAGIPAISVPCGETDGLPVGLQIIGKSFEDDKIIKIAEFLEK